MFHKILDKMKYAHDPVNPFYDITASGSALTLCYVEESRPPLWSSGQSSWLHNGDVL
jgi:hypothetical protein